MIAALPLVALPIALWLQAGVDRLATGQHVNAFPFTLVEQGHLTMGGLLTLLNLLEHLVWGVRHTGPAAPPSEGWGRGQN